MQSGVHDASIACSPQEHLWSLLSRLMPNAVAYALPVLEYTVSEGRYNTEIGLSILVYLPFLAVTSHLSK